MEKKGTKIAYFVALAVVVVALVIAKVTNDGSGFVATGWALFPPVVAIALALISKEVYSSLFLGCVAAALLLALMLLYLFITVYVYAIQARFVNTVFKTIINAFMMAVRHLPSTVLMIILNSVFFYIMFHYASWLGFWVLSGPVYLNSLLLCRIFKRYMRTDAKEITETDRKKSMERLKNYEKAIADILADVKKNKNKESVEE